MEFYIGTLHLFGFNFAPRGWAKCDGQILSIAQNTALFSLLGTTYGGNGQTTFALPDLRGRVPLHHGQGPGLASRTMGEVGGVENVSLLPTQMPAHSHSVNASSSDGTRKNPSGALPAGTPGSTYDTTADVVMAANMVGVAGGGQPHQNLQPYLVLNWCICLEGVFPSRN
jgi:microcystin-dependent protein